MDNAKKVLLSEPKVSQTDKLQSLVELIKSLASSSDDDIESILRSDLPDDEKAKQYIEALRVHRIQSKPKAKIETETDILENFMPEKKPKAKRLLREIKPYVQWTKDGELIHNQSIVPNSNISELINATIGATSKLPAGYEEYANSLKAARLSRDFIPNNALWSYLNPKKRDTLAARGWLEY